MDNNSVVPTSNDTNGSDNDDFRVESEKTHPHEGSLEMKNGGQEENLQLGRKIFVGNVGYRIYWQQLKDFFSQFATVVAVHMPKDHLKKRSRGIAFVTFSTAEEADSVLQLPDKQLIFEGRTLRIHPAEESKRTSFKKHDQVEELSYGIESTVIDDSVCHLNDLCDDLLLKIFFDLDIKQRLSMERVCKRWNTLCLQTWNVVKSLQFANMFQRFKGLTDKMLHTLLLRCGFSLTHLDLSDSPRLLTDYALDIIAHFCPNLAYLDLSGVNVTNKSLKNLTIPCNKLKVIKLERCFHVGEKGLWWVLHHCKELELVNMTSNASITGKCFHMAGPKLKYLNLIGCSSLCDTGVMKITERCPALSELRLHCCTKLTDTALYTIGNHLPCLTTLQASGSYPETLLSAWASIGNLLNLTSLDLSMNIYIGDAAITAISHGCSKLVMLDISGCQRNVTDVGLRSLSHLPCLEDINVSYILTVTDEMLQLIGVKGRLCRLTARACGGITDVGVVAVATNCMRLVYIDLSGNMQLTNESLIALLHSTNEFPRDLSANLGGTSIVTEAVEMNSHVTVNMMDLSMHHLRSDREFFLPEPYDGDDVDSDLEENKDASGNFQPAGQEVGECPWLEEDEGQYDDLCYDFLDNDDPLNYEEMS